MLPVEVAVTGVVWLAGSLVGCPAEDTSVTDTELVEDTGRDSDTPQDTGTPPPKTVWGTGVVITVDPAVATVLHVDWTQEVDAESGWLAWEHEGATFTSRARPIPPGPAHDVVLGLPASVTVPISLHLVIDGAERVIPLGEGTTGPLPSLLDEPQLDVQDAANMRPERYLLTSVDVGPNAFFGPCFTVILDDLGRVVWYRRTSESRLTWQARASEIGPYLLIDETTYYTSGAGLPSVSRVSLDGARDEAVELGNIGVAYDEMEDGSLLFGEDVDGFQFYLTRQYPDGTRERIWDCLAWNPSANFWDCNTNTVEYDPGRGSVLWSMFETDTVVEVDLATGEVLRVMGQHPDSYSFDPPSSVFTLQHFPNWSADGRLMVSTHSVDGTKQWAREFTVDDLTGTLTQVWSIQSPYWAQYAGQLQKLPSGHLLWQLGVTGVIHELKPDGTVVWQVSWADHLVGNATPLADLYAFVEPGAK